MYKTFVPRFLRRRGGADDSDDDMFRCRAPSQLPLSNYSSTVRASRSSAMLPPPPSTADTYVNSPRFLSHHDSRGSMRKPEPTAALLSTIPDECDDFAEVDPRFPRRSQIGMALGQFPTPPRIIDEGGYGGGSWQQQHDRNNNTPSSPYSYSPMTPPISIYSTNNFRSHSRNESAPSTPTTTTTTTRHHSFSRPPSRSVDHGGGGGGGPHTPRLPTHSIELSRGRSRSRSRSRAAAGAGAAFSRDASHDSSSSRVPMSRFNGLTGGGSSIGRRNSSIGRSNSRAGGMAAGSAGGGGPDLMDDGASSAGVSMTTIWSDAPRRGSKHSRI